MNQLELKYILKQIRNQLFRMHQNTHEHIPRRLDIYLVDNQSANRCRFEISWEFGGFGREWLSKFAALVVVYLLLINGE